jgi:hypothetical protein
LEAGEFEVKEVAGVVTVTFVWLAVVSYGLLLTEAVGYSARRSSVAQPATTIRAGRIKRDVFIALIFERDEVFITFTYLFCRSEKAPALR